MGSFPDPAMNPRLPAKLQLAAGLMAQRPDLVAARSLRTLARLAGVAPATMVRLAHALGFDSYDALRETFVARLAPGDGRGAGDATSPPAIAVGMPTPSASGAPAPTLTATPDAAGIPPGAPDDHAAALRAAVAASMDPRTLTEAVARLRGASEVVVLGLRTGRAIACHLVHGLGGARERVRLLEGPGDALLDEVAALPPHALLVVASPAPHARLAVQAARLARERGKPMLLISDDLAFPLAGAGAPVLTWRSGGQAPFGSTLQAFALAEHLALAVAAADERAARERGSRARRHLARIGAHWNPAWTPPSS